MIVSFKKIIPILMFISIPFVSHQSIASLDSTDEDQVIDAPWRTTRDYLPVLFFLPEFDTSIGHKLRALRLYNYDPVSKQKESIFIDRRTDKDDYFRCNVSFIDPEGKARRNLSKNESVDSFWHYIARVPVACIGMGGMRGKPGVHYLYGEIGWKKKKKSVPFKLFAQTEFKVLRVVVSNDGFAKFSPVDHHYDVHVHTIAEQTTWSPNDVNASRSKFGGPLAMLMESAYALGMVDIQLNNGNWSDYKNKIITTDHNVFFSGSPYDSGSKPGYGPTSHQNGAQQEFQWYRDNLGELGGEEITLQGANGIPDGPQKKRKGSHLLSYGSPHMDGPWHGGHFQIDLTALPDPVGVYNNISIANAIDHMGSSNGFGYASHPESGGIGWSLDYYEQAIGLKNFNDGGNNSPIIQKNGSEFVFKGLQIWNQHKDMKSRDSGDIEDSRASRFDPYTPAEPGQKFEFDPNWRDSLDKTYEQYKYLVKRGLKYSFKGKSNHIFIRKLYLSAGTDAHGDFNDTIENGSATAEAEAAEVINFDLNHVVASNNAFGRFLTYTLTSQRYIQTGAASPPNCASFPFCGTTPIAPNYFPLNDYKEGNTVVTDGPIGRFAADANCRFNSDKTKLFWHDKSCLWENHDGMIGGRGKFDGGNTMLAPHGNKDVYVNAQWIGKNDYLSDLDGKKGQMVFNFVNLGRGFISHKPEQTERNGSFVAGRRRSLNIKSLNEVLGNPSPAKFPAASALLLEGQLGRQPTETKFITNPVWIAPYKMKISAPSTCPIKPGELKVSVEFGLSMDTKLPSPTPVNTVQKTFIKVGFNSIKKPTAKKETPTTSVKLKRYYYNGLNKDTATEFDSDTDREPYQGIRVLLKPLNSIGQSGSLQYNLSQNNSASWQAVEIPQEFNSKIIADAKYMTTNKMPIPCGSGWDAAKHKANSKLASYAVIVEQIFDMHNNYLNPIAKTFVVKKKKNIKDQIFERPTLEISPLSNSNTPKQLSCSKIDADICGGVKASCEILSDLGGRSKSLCRWPSKKNQSECSATQGIWTTSNSQYAKNHPKVVFQGKPGACITESRNIIKNSSLKFKMLKFKN